MVERARGRGRDPQARSTSKPGGGVNGPRRHPEKLPTPFCMRHSPEAAAAPPPGLGGGTRVLARGTRLRTNVPDPPRRTPRPRKTSAQKQTGDQGKG